MQRNEKGYDALVRSPFTSSRKRAHTQKSEKNLQDPDMGPQVMKKLGALGVQVPK
jgi:hypothetical protein